MHTKQEGKKEKNVNNDKNDIEGQVDMTGRGITPSVYKTYAETLDYQAQMRERMRKKGMFNG